MGQVFAELIGAGDGGALLQAASDIRQVSIKPRTIVFVFIF
jgi:hypothetical protein